MEEQHTQHNPPDDRPGLCCPHCGCPESSVVWVRHHTFTARTGEVVSKTIRSRECEHCGERFRTTERVSGT